MSWFKEAAKEYDIFGRYQRVADVMTGATFDN
jgi:hypothetical protein